MALEGPYGAVWGAGKVIPFPSRQTALESPVRAFCLLILIDGCFCDVWSIPTLPKIREDARHSAHTRARTYEASPYCGHTPQLRQNRPRSASYESGKVIPLSGPYEALKTPVRSAIASAPRAAPTSAAPRRHTRDNAPGSDLPGALLLGFSGLRRCTRRLL